MKIKVHTSVIGNNGYNNHARAFTTTLNKFVPIKIRNFTVGDSWNGISSTPHEGEPYMTNELRDMLSEQTLIGANEESTNHFIYGYDENFIPNINIVLVSQNHTYFYDNYLGFNIAYIITEEKKIHSEFLQRLLKFNQIWVVSEWQKNIYIKQGIPKEKIKVVREGVDSSIYYPRKTTNKNGRFKFIVVGRWEYRKATKEIIETFLKTFKNTEPIDLVLLTNNIYAKDGIKNTQDILKKYKIEDFRIKSLPFLNREEYIEELITSDVFLSCSRSEGWNLPLIEAMACGIPSIYSNCSGQLEFAKGKGHPIDIIGPDSSENFYEPDFNHLSVTMRNLYENNKEYKKKAIEESRTIREKFSWSNSVNQAYDILSDIDKTYEFDRTKELRNLIKCDGKDLTTRNWKNRGTGFRVSIPDYVGSHNDTFEVKFFDGNNVSGTTMKPGEYTSTERTYHTDWKVQVVDIKTNKIIIDYTLDSLEGKTILVHLDSSSLGDNVIWFPQIEELRKQKKCKVICWWTNNKYMPLWMENYPDIDFIYGNKYEVEAHLEYKLGWIGWNHETKTEEDRQDQPFDTTHSPINYQTQPLGKTASDQLGIDYKPIKPIINISKYKRNIQERYVCINTMSTAQSKYWNYGYQRGESPQYDYGLGWQLVVYYLNSIGYKVVVLNKDRVYGYKGDGYDKRVMWNDHNFKNVINKTGPNYTIGDRISDLKYADFYMGLNSGMSWIAWAVGTPVINIVNLQPPEFFFPAVKSISRSKNHQYDENICTDCCVEYPFKRDLWMMCPRHYDTEREFECSTTITPKMVISKIKEYMTENNLYEGLK